MFQPAEQKDGVKHNDAEQKNLRILLLEDNPADAELVLRKLRVSGFRFTADLVTSSAEFMPASTSIAYDVILADYRIPDWTGLEALRWLRSKDNCTPFILVTGTLGDELAIECIKAGANDYVLKENLERLPVAMRRALEGAELRRQRDRLEKEKRETEEQYRLLFETNPQPMWVFDRETLEFLAVNEAAIRHYGYSRQEFNAMTIIDIRPTEDIPALRSSLQNRLSALQDATSWRHRLKSGRIIDVEITAHELKFRGRDAQLVLASDVTEKRKNIEFLEQSEERFSKVFNASPLAITIADLKEERYIDVNDAFLTMLEHQRDNVIGRTVGELRVWLDPTLREQMIRELEAGRPVTGFEAELLTASGKKKLVQIAAEFIHLDAISCVLAIMHDITDSRSLEEQFRQAQKMEAVGELAGGMAHDFNNMLSIISGYTDLAMEQLASDNPACQRMRQIKNATQRAAALTRRLLAFSRQQVLQPVVLNLNVLIANVKEMLEQITGENIRLTIRPGNSLDMVRIDRSQMEQVLLNLTVNARDATPDGGEIVLETGNVMLDELYAKTHPGLLPGNYVRISVSDTGTGMDKETLSRIFEPFFTTKLPGKGTGLGLSMVYGVIRQSGGHIWAYSEPGKGATFKIYLPSVKEKLAKTGSLVTPGSVSRGWETILLVEDDAELRSLTAELLAVVGYRIVEAQNGEDAAALVGGGEQTIDLVLTDVILPGMSGPDLVQQIQKLQPSLRVLYMSGYAGAQISKHGILEGAEFLEKPFTKESLLGQIRKILGAKESE
jgi:two-component system cell cycle sensor histidine kinase/response regulator CckA